MVLTVAIMVFLAPVGMTDTTDGLVAHWDFNEGEGSVLHDRHGENNGRIFGAQWVPCGNGHALRFDGDTNTIDPSPKSWREDLMISLPRRSGEVRWGLI